MRLVSVPRAGQSPIYVEGKNCWPLPPGSLFSEATSRLKTLKSGILKKRFIFRLVNQDLLEHDLSNCVLIKLG